MVIGYGETLRVYKTLKKSKSLCEGCHCDFYNSKNPMNIKECWHYATAQVADKLFYPNTNSYDKDRIKMRVLACYRG